MKTFDLIKQYKIFEKDINKRVLKVLSSGSYILGQNVKSFEKGIFEVFQLAMLSVIASDLVEVGKNIYSERKDGMKELMSFLGLTPFDYWASHILTT